MTFAQYCRFLISNYFSAHGVEFQFSTLLLLDISRQKVQSKTSRKLKIEILLVESKRRSECGSSSTHCVIAHWQDKSYYVS